MTEAAAPVAVTTARWPGSGLTVSQTCRRATPSPAVPIRRMVSLWDSDTGYERFRDEKLVPALRGFGRVLPTIKIWPIQTIRMLRTS